MAKKDKLLVEIKDPLEEAQKAINARLDFQQNLIYAVLLVVGVGFIAMVISVFAIFIDHKDYATKRFEEYIDLLEKKSASLEQAKSGNNQQTTPEPPKIQKPNTENSDTKETQPPQTKN